MSFSKLGFGAIFGVIFGAIFSIELSPWLASEFGHNNTLRGHFLMLYHIPTPVHPQGEAAEAMKFEFLGKLCPGCLGLLTFCVQIPSPGKIPGIDRFALWCRFALQNLSYRGRGI